MHIRGERVKILYLRTYYVNDPLVVLIATYFPVGHRSIYIINLQIIQICALMQPLPAHVKSQ